MSDHAMSAAEKIASIPPATVFITSIMGVVNWQTSGGAQTVRYAYQRT